MNKPSILFLVAAGLLCGWVGRASAEDEAKTSAPPPKWQDDPSGRFVFFAVLEGLYEDGVPNEVVNLIVHPAQGPDQKVKHCFVLQCEICHAAYEAFVLYSRRQEFADAKGRSTFGTGIDPKIVTDLKCNEPATRVLALGRMMRPWIVRRAEKMKLSDEEKIKLMDVLMQFKKDAGTKLNTYRKDDPAYKEWLFYGGCQACEAATNLSHTLKENQPAK